MPRYNTKFDLSLEDMNLIETALRTAARIAARADDDAAGVDPREANELLGRLHNQKVFFRPRDGVYVSG